MINDPIISTLGQKLMESAVTQRVVANNLANSETPNYKAFRVMFDRSMASQGTDDMHLPLARTNARHLGDAPVIGSGNNSLDDLVNRAGAQLVRDSSTTLRNDGNNVDVDRELADLSANTLYYGALTTFVKNRFDGYRRIISGNR